jgi:hypothetical protein
MPDGIDGAARAFQQEIAPGSSRPRDDGGRFTGTARPEPLFQPKAIRSPATRATPARTSGSLESRGELQMAGLKKGMRTGSSGAYRMARAPGMPPAMGDTSAKRMSKPGATTSPSNTIRTLKNQTKAPTPRAEKGTPKGTPSATPKAKHGSGLRR